MKISPLDIRNKRFEKRWRRGVDEEEVRVFLDATASEMEAVTREMAYLKENLKKAEASLEEYREREKALKDTLVMAQRMTEEIRSGALKEAESVVSEARLQADQIVANAHNRQSQLLEELQDLKGQRTQMLAQLRATIETHSKVLEITEQQLANRDAVDDRIVYHRGARATNEPREPRGR